jgi:hypothetical protein
MEKGSRGVAMNYEKPGALEEFDVEKYAALERFDQEAWAALIDSRLICKRMIEAAQQWRHSENGALNPFAAAVEELIKHLMDTPLTPFGKGLRNTLLHKSPHQPAVRSLLVEDIFALHRAVMENAPVIASVKNRQIQYWAPDKEHSALFCTSIDEAVEASEHYRIRTLARFQVDLDASNGQIFDDFKKLLSLYRKRTAFAPPPITTEKFRQWIRNRVLPYADLQLWVQWTNAKLKKSELVALLFPNEVEIPKNPIGNAHRDYIDAISNITVTALRRSTSMEKQKK